MTRNNMDMNYKEALAEYITPHILVANETRIRLGLTPVDVFERADIIHKIDYFQKGFKDGKGGYYDRWYDDKKACDAYREGNYAGRKLFNGEFQLI